MITSEIILLTKIMINFHRRNQIKQIVVNALLHSGLNYLPLDIKKICKSYDYIRLIPFSVHMKHRHLTYEDICTLCETEDACADYYADKDKYIIYYNDITSWNINSNRYRWSIAHELGHILLEHHKKNAKTRIFRNLLSSNEYKELETEADYFASLILVPYITLLGFKIDSPKKLKLICQISDAASKRRFKDFQIWKQNLNPKDEYDIKIFHFYYDFIYKKRCKNCNVGIIQRYGKYCPICGSKNTLEWGDGNTMKYPLIDTYDTGKLTICPNCKNEETSICGDYCQICGLYLVNRCTQTIISQCPTLLPSNARYCPVCGKESIFLKHGILRKWDYQENENTLYSFNDELPFQ